MAISALQEGLRLRTQGVYLGTDARDRSADPERVSLSPEALRYSWQVIGPSGSGKTYFLFWLFQMLTFLRGATLTVIDPKPGAPLFHKARNWCLSRGLTKRLAIMDLSDQSVTTGYNPLKPNGLAPATQAKAIREAILSAWGQTGELQHTPQLARYLYLSLYVACLLQLTLPQALELLQPGSTLRRELLPKIPDPEARRALYYLDQLRESRQSELTASSTARLESFVNDPFFRAMFTQQETLDIGQIIQEQKILLINPATYRPCRIDDVKLFSRFVINDVLANVFQNGSEKRPVFLFLDEAHLLVSKDLCAALDMGRELGLRTIISHQFLHQLSDEDTSGYLLHSVLTDCRVKCIFGNLPPEDLEILTKPMAVKSFNPKKVKDEIWGVETWWKETTRVSRTRTHTKSKGEGLARPQSESESENEATTKGTINSLATALHKSKTKSKNTGQARGVAHATGISSGQGFSMHAGMSSGTTILPDGQIISTSGDMDSTTAMDFTGQSAVDTEISTAIETQGEAETEGLSEIVQRGETQSNTTGGGRTRTKGIVPSVNKQETWGESETRSPFLEPIQKRIVTSRTFMTPEEQALEVMQRVQRLPTAHFLALTPETTWRYVKAPWLRDPFLLPRVLAAGLAAERSRPYHHQIDINIEQQNSEEVKYQDGGVQHRNTQPDPRDPDAFAHQTDKLPAFGTTKKKKFSAHRE